MQSVAPQPRLDECSYFSEFLFAKHTLIPEIFVGDERSFPIATIVTGPQPSRTDHDDRNDTCRHQEAEEDRIEEERVHQDAGRSQAGSGVPPSADAPAPNPVIMAASPETGPAGNPADSPGFPVFLGQPEARHVRWEPGGRLPVVPKITDLPRLVGR
jgi:hypothetical protein